MNSTLYNMTFGALGAIALLLGIQLTKLVNRLGLGTRVRAAYRRLIGMTHFEEMVLSELRIYRTDVDRLTRDLNASVRRRDNDIGLDRDAIRSARTRHNALRREVEELGIMLHQYTEALGPMWTTAQGHSMPLRLLSTSHLRNIRDGGFGGYEVREFVDRELERRSIDAQWRAAEAEGKRAPTRREVIEQGPSILDPRTRAIPFAVPADTMARVERVLPVWVQQVIDDLRYGRITSVPRGMRQRMNKQPKWARELVFDIVRRANR